MRRMLLRAFCWLREAWRTPVTTKNASAQDERATAALPRRRRRKALLKRLSWRATLRGVLFWTLAGIAALLIYTERVPMFTASLGVQQAQDGYTFSDFAVTDVPLDLQFSAWAANDDAATEATTPATLETTPVEPVDAAPAPDLDAPDDAVAAVLAELPAFTADALQQPVAGEIVQPAGWYRHEAYGDWRLAPGVTIAPAQPSAVVAAAYTGVVEQVTKTAENLWHITLLHQDGWQTEYGGLAEVSTTPGVVVRQGERLGVTAATADAVVTFTLRHGDEPVEAGLYW